MIEARSEAFIAALIGLFWKKLVTIAAIKFTL